MIKIHQMWVLLVIFAVVSACTDDNNSSCVGDVCGNSCPETITMKTASLEADGDTYRFPDGLNEVASINFGCLLDSAMGTYESPDGEWVTISPDPDGFALYPEESVLSGCANWILPVVITTMDGEVRGGILSESPNQCSGEEIVFEGTYGVERMFQYGASIGQLDRDFNDPWFFKIQNTDGNMENWTKQ